MPATFQKIINKTLKNIESKLKFLNDTLITAKSSLAELEKELDKVVIILKDENLATNLQKFEIAIKK